ncbi:cytochrome c/c1 heme lyase-domain-containing protein [Xylariales sp. PMI_506]|nr:cytochrome c/c1 heme lyase-domain-containing protein [Xylariales sp. PMI_506]
MLLDLLDQIFLDHHKNAPETLRRTPSMSDSRDSAATCPVDHNSREAWLAQARAASESAAAAQAQQQQQSQPLPPSHPPIPSSSSDDAAAACPVDHKARDVWIQQARAAAATSSGGAAEAAMHTPTQPPSTTPPSWSSSILSYIPFAGSSSSSSASQQPQAASSVLKPASSNLGTSREISTIPRSSAVPSSNSSTATTTTEVAPSARPANHEQETGADPASGNWIYPSERMFFEAMKRKGHDPQAADMQTVVPIHNAVNERAWAEIKKWEEPWTQGTSCGGPRLHSFSGLSTKLSPKARINTLLGYQSPFDRHDWVVDRCGTEIEYIIDFYAGRQAGGPEGKLSFYLDVRPKLNSWEGVKMRFMKSLGLV